MNSKYEPFLKNLFIFGTRLRIKDKKGHPIQPFSINFYDGYGINDSHFSCIVRPFRKLLEKGTPVKNISFVTYKNKNDNFILGSFTFTGKRLIFFPGMNLSLQNPSEDYLKKRKLDFLVDHMSLENDFETCHETDISKPTSKHKLSTKRTKKLSESLYLWFFWEIKPNVLEKLPATQLMFIRGTEKEMAHKTSLLFDVNHDDKTISFETNENLDGSHYWHFEFFVHKNKIDHDPYLRELAIHPGFLADFPRIVSEDRKIIEVQIKAIHLEDFDGTIFIRSCKLKGSFPTDSIMEVGGKLPDFKE